MNLVGKCVVSGNIRRSAEIALGEADDEVFINLKNDREKLTSHRWASNNSIIADETIDIDPFLDNIKRTGEPGFFFLDNARKYGRLIDGETWGDKDIKGVNPCGEIGLESTELCNLVETFPSNHESIEEYKETLKYAYLLGKTNTLINTNYERTNAVILKNRRIGISQSGIAEFLETHRSTIKKYLDESYKYLKELDEEYSNWLCIPNSIKITTVKPSGTVSILAGVSSGIHYPFSKYYIRRVRIAKNSKEILDLLKEHNYPMEDSVTDSKTMVVSFPMMSEKMDRFQDDIGIWEQFANVYLYQKYWADNQVSVTIHFDPDKIEELKYVFDYYKSDIKGISFMPLNQNHYAQMPLEKISKEEYDEVVKDITPLPKATNVSIKIMGSVFCDGDSCTLE